MTRKKQIDKAARVYATHVVDTDETDFYASYTKKLDFVREEYAAFRAGVKWADANPIQGDLSQVWHPAEEEPESGRWILYERQGYGYLTYLSGYVNCEWRSFIVIFTVTRWAYVNELLPKGGEE